MNPPSTPLSELRTEYKRAVLDEQDVDPDPLIQFNRWFEQAVAAQVPEPNAMTLATADAEGRPSARIVLLKDTADGAFTFYTNYASRKGRELAARPLAALLFFWPELERQVRIEGAISRGDDVAADRYFASRPRLSRLGAWASPQSEPLPDRATLEAGFAAAAARFPGEDVARPPHWGGYRLVPGYFEYWQGRRSRLHDRIAYRRNGTAWQINRLAP
jgi:pyridoxamine 5'-phosphate oxidase